VSSNTWHSKHLLVSKEHFPLDNINTTFFQSELGIEIQNSKTPIEVEKREFLIIRKFNHEHKGHYKCVANNSISQAEIEFEIVIGKLSKITLFLCGYS
jgi:hypothetical protein